MATFNEKTIKDKNGDIVNNYVIISERTLYRSPAANEQV